MSIGRGSDARSKGDSFEVMHRHVDYGACVVTPVGALDISSAPDFKAAIVEALSRGCSQLIVDVAQVTFVDATALALLKRAKKIRLRKGDLAIVCPDAPMAQQFTRAGFAVFATLDEAARQLELDPLQRGQGRQRRSGVWSPRSLRS